MAAAPGLTAATRDERQDSFRMPEASQRIAGVDVMVETAVQHTDNSGEHMVYPIVITAKQDNHVGIAPGDFRVQRRYNAFAYISRYLEHAHPSCLIPPMPEKKLNFKLSKFSVDINDEVLLRKRRQALGDMIKRVLVHPVLGKDKGFHLFLTQPEGWQDALVVTDLDGQSVPYSPSNFADLFRSTTMSNTRSAREFRDIFNYADQFQEHLASIMSIHSRLAMTMEAIMVMFSDTATMFDEWQETEQGLRDVMVMAQGAMEKLSARLDKQLRREEEFADQVKVYVGYGESLRRLALTQQQYQQAADKARAAADDKDTVLHNFLNPEGDTSVRGFFSRLTGPTSMEGMAAKKEQLTAQVEELRQEASNAQQRHENFLQDALAEVETFHKDKRKTLLSMFLVFANIQKAYAEAQVRLWNKLHRFLALAPLQDAPTSMHASKPPVNVWASDVIPAAAAADTSSETTRAQQAATSTGQTVAYPTLQDETRGQQHAMDKVAAVDISLDGDDDDDIADSNDR
eukprot:TRINITY_DN12341_c3_g1_i7.p1 TRINITY_DN12341_c3_g1~~TRINITY_DN12341_c3_g1_i7.p1  ORF type:complete len:528 (+),score=130.16 TRINITY_DN12341_c3_g1_i7:40-1584(+)